MNYNNAEQRLSVLREAGINTDNLYGVRCAAGEEPSNPDNSANDTTSQAILNGGTIPDRRLFRRWVTGQMFHMLDYEYGYCRALRVKGYEYCWKMLVEEFRVQAVLARHDTENYTDRNRWFNKNVAVKTAEKYMRLLTRFIKNQPTGRYQKKYYKNIAQYGRVFCRDINEKVIQPLENLIQPIRNADNAASLAEAVAAFNACRVKLSPYNLGSTLTAGQAFIDAYKGSGAFFTLKNLILFHGLHLNNECLTENDSLRLLNAKAEEYADEGWRLLGLLKQTLTDNHIDIRQKMDEWKQAKKRQTA